MRYPSVPTLSSLELRVGRGFSSVRNSLSLFTLDSVLAFNCFHEEPFPPVALPDSGESSDLSNLVSLISYKSY
jgi:hypothetical protein